MKHVHKLKAHWVLATGIADAQGWYRVVLWARCIECGIEGAFSAMQSTTHAAGRLLDDGE